MATRTWQPDELKLFVRRLDELLGEYDVFSGYRMFIPMPDDLAIAKMMSMTGLRPDQDEVIAKGFGDDGPLMVFPKPIDFPLSMENLQLREVGFNGAKVVEDFGKTKVIPCMHGKKPLLVLLILSGEFYWAEEECHDCWVRVEEFLIEAGFNEVPES